MDPKENSNKGLKVAVLVLFIFFLIATFAFFYKGKVEETITLKTSDAENIKVSFHGNLDGWPGYIPIASNLLQNKLRAKGIDFQWTSDKGDYQSRVQALNNGEIDFTVITVDAHQLNKVKDNLVGVEIMVIDESHGGDATIAWRDCGISKISDLNSKPAFGKNNPDGWKMTYLENTPSHQQVRTIGRDFGIDTLLSSEKEWYVSGESDKEIYEKFKNKEVCVITTWEPWKNKLLSLEGTVELYSSRNADKDIVDLLIVNRELLEENNPKFAYLETIIDEYFDVLQQLKDDNNLLLEQAKLFLDEYAGLSGLEESEISTIVSGVKWINLRDNAENWFGLAGQKYFGLLEAHENARNIIKEDEDHKDHLKGFDFSKIINSNIIRKLYLLGGYSQNSDKNTVTDSLSHPFSQLNDQQWTDLIEVGELKAKPIIFLSGDSSLSENSDELLNEIMDELKHYPNFRIELIPGYFTTANVDEEKATAEQRAKNVMEYIISNYNIDRNRVRVFVPSPENVKNIIPMLSNESSRSYGSRLRQVHFILKNTAR